MKADIGSAAATLTTPSLKVTVQHAPLRISFANASGEILDADDPGRGMSFAGSEFRIAKQLHVDDHVYGFGEKNGRLDKRGWQFGGYNYVMWNSDTPAYDSSTDPLYADIPFFLVLRGGQAHGIFLDNTWRSFFDVGREQSNLLTFGADGDPLRQRSSVSGCCWSSFHPVGPLPNARCVWHNRGRCAANKPGRSAN